MAMADVIRRFVRRMQHWMLRKAGVVPDLLGIWWNDRRGSTHLKTWRTIVGALARRDPGVLVARVDRELSRLAGRNARSSTKEDLTRECCATTHRLARENPRSERPSAAMGLGRVIASLAILGPMVAGTAAAAICPACVGGYLPVRGLTASSIGGETSISFYYDQQRRDALFQDGRRVANPGGMAVTLRSVTAGADWAATPRWTLGVLVPWVSYVGRLPGPAGGTLRPSSSGLGDALALARGDLWGGRFTPSRGSVTLGIKAPTGARSTTDATGNLLPPSVQPGTGRWDGFAALSATRNAHSWTLVGEAAGRAGAQAVGFPAGSNLIMSAAASRQVAGLLLGVASFSWRWQDPEPAAFPGGVGAGGWQADVTPGLQWITGDRGRLEAGVRLLLARRLSGLQLGERYGITAGGRLVF